MHLRRTSERRVKSQPTANSRRTKRIRVLMEVERANPSIRIREDLPPHPEEDPQEVLLRDAREEEDLPLVLAETVETAGIEDIVEEDTAEEIAETEDIVEEDLEIEEGEEATPIALDILPSPEMPKKVTHPAKSGSFPAPKFRSRPNFFQIQLKFFQIQLKFFQSAQIFHF